MNQLATPYSPAWKAGSRNGIVQRKRRPSPLILGFLIMICLPPTIAGYVGTLLITPYRLYMLVLFPYLLLRLFLDKKLRAGPADVFVLLYAVWTAICAIKNVPGGTQRAGQTILETVSAYMLARVAIRSMADLLYTVRMLFVISMIAFALAIPEAVTHYKFVLSWTSSITGMPYYQYAPGTDVRLGLRRPQAFFANPILYGLFCATALSLIWYTTKSTTSRVIKTGLLAAATFLSLSSGPLLAANVQVLMIVGEAITKRVKNRVFISVSAVSILTILLDLTTNSGIVGIVVNHLTFNSDSAFNRILIWQWGIYNIKLHPILGLDSTQWIRPSFMKPSCDDFWIAITMDGGIPCLVFLLAGMAILLSKLGKLDTTKLPPIYSKFRTGWAFSFIAFSFTGFSVMFFGALQPFYFFVLGLAGAMIVIYRNAEQEIAGPCAGKRGVQPVQAKGSRPIGSKYPPAVARS